MPGYQDDSGDIALLLPSSHSSPQLSSTANEAGPSRYRDVSSPTPRRFEKSSLWTTSSRGPHALGRQGNGESEDEDLGTPLASRASSATYARPGVLRSSPLQSPTRRPSSTNTVPLAARPTMSASTFSKSPAALPSSLIIPRARSISIRLPSMDSSLRPGSASATAATPSVRVGWRLGPGETRPPQLISNETAGKMSRWVKEIVVCNFDLERGPVVERRIMGRAWGREEKANVAFSSFPDTSLFSEGSIMFSFKIRHTASGEETGSQSEPSSPLPLSAGTMPSFGDAQRENKAEEYRRWDEKGREWLYGFVWFEQRRDGGIARGYMQKSLVILTHLPFPSFFAAVLEKVAPIFFQHGYSALEAACHAIASWPDPQPGNLLELPLLSEVVTVKIPDVNDTPQVTTNVPRPILASLPLSSPLRTLAPLLPSLWSLWECLILAEPVLVIAPDPRTSSEIVWWLRDLLRPIPPAGDFRPYLHIHDHDFALLVNANKPQPGIVVGVTNPFFRNAASHWPNVISIPAEQPKRRSGANGANRQPDVPEGFISRRNRSVSKDRPLLKRLETLVAEGNFDDPEANDALRDHFRQLTEKMLVPLNRYFQTLVPAPSSVSATPTVASGGVGSVHAGPTSGLKPFSIPAFLTHLKTRGPNPLSFKSRGLTTKSRVEADFYASFCMSPTFAGWLASRVDSLGLAVAAAEAGQAGSNGANHSAADGGGGSGLGLDDDLTRAMGDVALSEGTGSTTTLPRASIEVDTKHL